jgi:hypothetical protein
LSDADHRRARAQAERQYEHSRELGWRDKAFSTKYRSGEDPVYFGELGEIAVERQLVHLQIPFVPGLKSGVDRPEDITHDFYVAGRSIGVKTEVPTWCRTVWEFAKESRFGCIYTVRSPGSGYGGSHGYPDIMVHCLYFPHVNCNELWVTGFVDRATLTAAPAQPLFGKPMHCLPPHRFTAIEMIHTVLY